MVTQNQNHIFEIVSKTIKKGVFSKQEVLTHFKFKTHTQTDLCQWMAAVHSSIDRLIPAGPPSPIFMSQKTLEENVVALIKDRHARVWSSESPAQNSAINPIGRHLESWSPETFTESSPILPVKAWDSNMVPADSGKDSWLLKDSASIAEVSKDDAFRRNSWAHDDFYEEAGVRMA
jgi:hypothetical protein